MNCYWYSPKIKCFLLGECKCLINSTDQYYELCLPLLAGWKTKYGENSMSATKERRNES